MRMKLVIEHEGNTVSVEPSQGDIFDPVGQGEAGTVAAPNWLRLGQIATCVVSCLASTAREHAAQRAAEKGGQHETPPAEPPAAPPGGPRNNPPRPR